MADSLFDLLPSADAGADELLGRFLEYVDRQGLTLYPAQAEASLALLEDQNVILYTPTGSGKSLAAFAMHFASLARGRRSVYTCPIKALVNEGMTMIIVTHEIGFAREVSDWILYMDHGAVIEEGPPTILNEPKTERLRQFLGQILDA